MATFESLRIDYSSLLLKSYSNQDVAQFQKKCIEMCPAEADRRVIIDQVLREVLTRITGEKTMDEIVKWYLPFCIQICRKELATATMPIILLGDMFDCNTLNQCEVLFTFVEDNVAIWKEEVFFAACKNNLLRMCNDLLRRLSRSQQTVFCGRILLFLAKFFPFSERSGLNLISEFNLDNHTEFGSEKSEEEVLKEMDKIKSDKAENKIPIDYNLYTKFWALQDFFRNPNQCYNKVHWKIFSAHASSVLSAFSSFKLEEQRNYTTISSKTDTSKMDTSSEAPHKEMIYFAKYLTNQKLLELQLSDSNFRRYVLLQFLILFQYLNSTVKFKPETHELKSDQNDWVKTTSDLVYTLLSETPPDGQAFAETVKNILKREEHWNSWKNDGCPAFKRPLPDSQDSDEVKRPSKKRRRIGDVIKDAQAVGKYQMGHNELTKLWNLCPDNLEACKSRERDFLPSLEVYFEEAIEQSNPAAMIEDEYKKVNDGNFGWRALRLLARRSPHFFVHSNYPMTKLPEYLDTMIKKIPKERLTQADIKIEPEEIPPAEVPEQEYNFLKQEPETMDADNTEQVKENKISPEIVEKLSEIMKNDWKKLAAKLGYKEDEIEYFEGKPTAFEQCKNMLGMWVEEAEDPAGSLENLKDILESLKCKEALAILEQS